MMIEGGAQCRPLRRTVWAVLIGGVYGALILFTAFLLASIAAIQQDFLLGVFAACVFVGWSLELGRGVKLCEEELVIRSFLLRRQKVRVDRIRRIEVGMRRESGLPGYVGFVVAVETASVRMILEPGRYCGRDRLSDWVALISRHQDFVGEVRVTLDEVRASGTA